MVETAHGEFEPPRVARLSGPTFNFNAASRGSGSTSDNDDKPVLPRRLHTGPPRSAKPTPRLVETYRNSRVTIYEVTAPSTPQREKALLHTIVPLCKLGGRQAVEVDEIRVAKEPTFRVGSKTYFHVTCLREDWVLEPEVFVSKDSSREGRGGAGAEVVDVVTAAGVERRRALPAVDYALLANGFAANNEDAVDFFTCPKGGRVDRAIWETSVTALDSVLDSLDEIHDLKSIAVSKIGHAEFADLFPPPTCSSSAGRLALFSAPAPKATLAPAEKSAAHFVRDRLHSALRTPEAWRCLRDYLQQGLIVQREGGGSAWKEALTNVLQAAKDFEGEAVFAGLEMEATEVVERSLVGNGGNRSLVVEIYATDVVERTEVVDVVGGGSAKGRRDGGGGGNKARSRPLTLDDLFQDGFYDKPCSDGTLTEVPDSFSGVHLVVGGRIFSVHGC